MTTIELTAKLAKKYPEPGFTFMEQVRNGTGFARNPRTADALAMGLWPSRGLHLHGFELKTSRNDWLNELKNPEKAESLFQYCDFWWLVVSDIKIVEIGEIPQNWGVWVASGRGGALKVLKEAPKLEPKAIDPTFFASLCRSLTKTTVLKSTVEEEIKERVEQGLTGRIETNQRELERLQKLEQEVDKFAELTGINIRYSFGGLEQIAEAVNMVRHGRVKHIYNDFDQMSNSVGKILDTINKAKEDFEKVREYKLSTSGDQV